MVRITPMSGINPVSNALFLQRDSRQNPVGKITTLCIIPAPSLIPRTFNVVQHGSLCRDSRLKEHERGVLLAPVLLFLLC